ncbi:Der1-like family-domain-containing protein [Podospora australis]|uniref:Derlin n=1 Tax=Podospora australis TaxID=1536484 RepID=A0AAN6WZV0_9PEZI|nr:Der1-like family-domain-containing protein [Podospora australis]
MSEIMDAYWAMPPLSRALATAILVTSLSTHIFGILPYGWLYFHWTTIWQVPPQIWRLVTAFLVSTPKLGIVMDPYFVYQYLGQLERGNPKFARKEDVLWYLMTVCSMILAASSYFQEFEPFYISGLTMALCYTATQDQRGMKAGFFFFTVPAQLVPYCMLLFTMLQNPKGLPVMIIALLCAHLHDFLYRLWPEFGGGRNLLATPSFMSRLVQTPRIQQRDYGTAVRNNAAGSTGRTTGADTGSVLPDSWRTRGSGHRLG